MCGGGWRSAAFMEATIRPRDPRSHAHAKAPLEDLAKDFMKRVAIPINSSSPHGLVDADTQDPWSRSGKYALAWTYFSLAFLVFATVTHFYHLWGDKIRTAQFKEEVVKSASIFTPDSEPGLPSARTFRSTQHFFPPDGSLPEKPKVESAVSSIGPLNNLLAIFRWLFYRPVPVLKLGKIHIVLPSLATSMVVVMGLTLCILYSFVPQPLYFDRMSYGAPPVAVRAGMLSVAMMPWIVGLSMKANFVTFLTGIGHERLNVLHRWAAYLCLLLALVHAIPFYIQAGNDPAGFASYKEHFDQEYAIFTTGLVALAPLAFLSIHSLPFLRNRLYELFVVLHVPVAILFLGLLFWHCNNYLTSWHYLYSTTAIWFLSSLVRLSFLNWTNPLRMSWLIGEESAVTILSENAVKVIVPTQIRWRPGQYVYLRMPGISLLENHPFTIASLCSDDFPSDYGDAYRDMTLVFRPFHGFTRKILDTAVAKGPCKTYRAFIEGPYGGMQREVASFDEVIFFAGGSGITAIVSQLLDLIKRMRDGKAVTTTVRVIWSLKRPETMQWFQEELRICREYAPINSVYCSFYITAFGLPCATATSQDTRPPAPGRDHRSEDDNLTQGMAMKYNHLSERKDVAEDALSSSGGDTLSTEGRNGLCTLPRAYFPGPPRLAVGEKAPKRAKHSSPPPLSLAPLSSNDLNGFDFGFPKPSAVPPCSLPHSTMPYQHDGWRTEYGRPDIPHLLQSLASDFGRRTCVYVCGPPEMRVDVAQTVARLQHGIWADPHKDELFLHAENYAV